MVAHTPPNAKYVGAEGECDGEFLWAGRGGGVKKYFRHILIDHKILFKMFYEPQNIFLSSIFVILFFKLRGLKYKISKLAISEI